MRYAESRPRTGRVDDRANAVNVRPLLKIVLVMVVIGAEMKMAGMDVSLIDHPVGPFGDAGTDDAAELEPAGFNEFAP